MSSNNIKASKESQCSRFEPVLRETVAKTLGVDANDRMLHHFLAACEYGGLDPEGIADCLNGYEYDEKADVRRLIETGLEAKGAKVTSAGLYNGCSTINFEFGGGEYYVEITRVE